jgi:hypothetical protein
MTQFDICSCGLAFWLVGARVLLFAAKSFTKTPLARCVPDKLADKATGQGGNNKYRWKSNNPAF